MTTLILKLLILSVFLFFCETTGLQVSLQVWCFLFSHSLLCLRFVEESWWSQMPGRAMLGSMCASGRTWWGNEKVKSLNLQCLVITFFFFFCLLLNLTLVCVFCQGPPTPTSHAVFCVGKRTEYRCWALIVYLSGAKWCLWPLTFTRLTVRWPQISHLTLNPTLTPAAFFSPHKLLPITYGVASDPGLFQCVEHRARLESWFHY